jgi:two-component system phosphate regulon sensor histidine kinase PhoR
MKNEFVSMVSHELRTPLASIKAYIEMLIDGEAVDERTTREFYDVIQNEANRLGRLIDNILNISRIESGLVKVSKRPQPLVEIIREALESVAGQATQKRISLVERLPSPGPRPCGDRDMLYQVVLNLLTNAIKHTPDGGTITLETAAVDGGRKVVTRISDTGAGIPPNDLPFVFDKFPQSGGNSRVVTGTGLGLSLARHIVETVHGGRMFVESHMGRGSCFGFELDGCG